jgi:hypothetical protein
MHRVATALLVAVFLSGCTQTARPEPSPTVGTPTSSPTVVRTPVARTALAPEPIKEEFLLHNPLYRAGQITPVTCSLPTAKLTNKQTMLRYANAFVACLNRGWAPVITRAGFDFVPPSAVYSAPTGTKTDCSVMGEDYTGLYCHSNRGIYINWPKYIGGWSQETARAGVQYLVAHEYGHHVQLLTGIADQYGDRWSAVGTPALQTVEQNRMEMQAHCFAAAFLGANQDTLRIRGDRLAHYGHPGYDRSEAGWGNFDRWLRQGFKAKGPGACLTWDAPAGRVTGA